MSKQKTNIMACGEIALGSLVDCTNLPAAGTRAIAYVMNYDDIASYTESGGVITAITMVGATVAYKFTGLGNSFKGSADFARSANTGLGHYKHKESIIIYERTQAQKDNIKNFGNARVVVALLLNGTDADSIILLGKDVGLQLSPGEIWNAFANEGLFVLNMATPEGDTENESALPQSIYVTSRTATIAMLDALLV